MRIRVNGDNDVAKALRGNLQHEAFVVTGLFPIYEVTIWATTAQHIVIDGVDSEFERHIVNGIASLPGGRRILLDRGGETVNPRHVTITVPLHDDDVAHAVEIGVLRGVINATRPRPWRWWQPWR